MHPSIEKIIHFPITKIILGIAVCFSLMIGIQELVSKPIFYSFIANKEIADPIIHLISFPVLLFSYYGLFRSYGRETIEELSTQYLSKEVLGFIGGFLSISISILVLHILGNYQFLSISLTNYSVKLFTTLMVAALIEDLFHRGLIFRELENWLGTNIALVIVMLIETAHIFNPNANLFSLFTDLCWGFTMSMLFVYPKRIWLPFFFHLGWNFAQPFYGSNLTGLNNMGTIIHSEFKGSVWLTGGAVGIENSVITIFILLSIGIFLYKLAKKENKIIKRKTKTL